LEQISGFRRAKENRDAFGMLRIIENELWT
jgi:hypothetical protein